ncbi:MAG: hypothetical protein JRI68_20570 [Deltaproteobacteria bacterium]|nr:hypothetical protein [Deltaproteobacteria bacterium]
MTPPAATSPKRPKTLQLIVVVGLALFVLGWALGRCSSTEPPVEPTPTAPTVPAPLGTRTGATDGSPTEGGPPQGDGAELRLDAGGLRLVPDASLHLKPIVPLGGENLDE